MTKLLISSYIFLLVFVLGCTNFLMGKKKQISSIESDKNNVITNNELEKCSYINGFKDSINGQRPDDLCFLIKDEKYRRGFRNGTSYISKSEIKKSPRETIIS